MPPFAALAPVIGAGISGISSVLQNASQNRQIQKTNEFNKQFALDMYNLNRRDTLADWNRINEYNSPQAQIQRFKDAGLSPHLIYGQMTNAPVIKTPDAPKFEAMVKKPIPIGDSINNALSTYISTRQFQADMDLTAQNLKTKALNDEYIKANTLKVLQDTDIKKAGEQRMQELFPATLGKALADMEYANERWEAQDLQNEFNKKSFNTKLDSLITNLAKTKESITKSEIERKYLGQQIKLLEQKNDWYGLSEGQKIETGRILQEKLIKNIALMGAQQQSVEKDVILKDIKQSFKSIGVSESVTENIIRDILRIISPKK